MSSPELDSPSASMNDVALLPLAQVLIVDDHPLFAQGLAGLIRQEQLASEVVLAASVAEAQKALNTTDRISLVLLDIALPGETGLVLIPQMLAKPEPRPTVVISSSEDEPSVRAARAAGAMGFLPKSASRFELVRMFRTVSRGELFFPGWRTADSDTSLTPRQRDVLALLAQGYPNKRICQSLNLTEHTVKSHLKAIFAQLGVHNRTECVTRARRLGWL